MNARGTIKAVIPDGVPEQMTWPQARTVLSLIGYSDDDIRAASRACPGPGMEHPLPGGLHETGTDGAGLWYVRAIPARPASPPGPYRPVRPPFMTGEQVYSYLTSQGGGNYTSQEARNAVSGAMAIEGGIYPSLAFHDVTYVIEDDIHKGYVITPKQHAPARPASLAARLADENPGLLDDRELVMAVILWAMGKGAIITRSWFGLDQGIPDPADPGLSWLFSVIPVIDQALDDMAPEVFRRDDEASRIANMYRRFAAGPVSEAAEAIDALNGMTGGNPRKGITHTRTQLLSEAADTAFSALLAIQSQTKDIRQTWMIFTEAAAKAYSRVPDENRTFTVTGGEHTRGCATC